MSFNRKLFSKYLYLIKRYYADSPKKYKLVVKSDINEKLLNQEMKYRKHPGRWLPNVVDVPKSISEAIKKIVGDKPIKNLVNDSEQLTNYIKSRHLPPEQREINEKYNEINKMVENTKAYKGMLIMNKDEKELTNYRNKMSKLLFFKQVYAWHAIEYNEYQSLKYLVARGPIEYAILFKIFNEIKTRANFEPNTYFDFGSGIGTGIWAVNECWNKTVKEYFTVDISPDINLICRNLLKELYIPKTMSEESLFQRQFLPHSQDNKYDLVVSAYSLFELSSAKNRLKTVLSLWQKTKQFLVLVEYGSNAGYLAVCQARDFILALEDEQLKGHVFAPCPHDLECPRITMDQTPCNFEVKYNFTSINNRQIIQTDRFSYVVLRKGERQEDSQWPRIVRPVLERSNHVVCRMCCSNGKIEDIFVTKAKHGKIPYKCTKSSKWGDVLPFTVEKRDFIDEQIEENGEQIEESTSTDSVIDPNELLNK